MTVGLLMDASGIVVWTNDLISSRGEEIDKQSVALALAGDVVSELKHDVRLVDSQGRHYTSEAIER